MSDFPTTPDALDAARLTDYLRAAGQLAKGRVASVKHELIGAGKMADNARYTLAYEGEEVRAPATVVAKFPAADERARTMAGAQGAYYNEVMFYRAFAPSTAMRTPKIFASELSEDRASFLLLMEDMRPAGPGEQVRGESREHAALALGEVAKLASAFYDDPTLADRDHVAGGSADGGAFGQALMQQYWPTFLERHRQGITDECIAFCDRYVENHARFSTRFDGPRTLIHGDFRSENILFGDDTATTVDWQTTSHSSVLADAAYFLGGSIDIADRRDWERDLIEGYRIELEKGGVTLSAQDCWDQYREFAMHGIMITVLGASFSTPDARGDAMFLAMIQRHLQHCVDLDAGEFLG